MGNKVDGLNLLLSLIRRVEDGEVIADVVKDDSLRTVVSFDIVSDEDDVKVACKSCKWKEEGDSPWVKCHSPHSKVVRGYDPVGGKIEEWRQCKYANEDLDCKFYEPVEEPATGMLRRLFGRGK